MVDCPLFFPMLSTLTLDTILTPGGTWGLFLDHIHLSHPKILVSAPVPLELNGIWVWLGWGWDGFGDGLDNKINVIDGFLNRSSFSTQNSNSLMNRTQLSLKRIELWILSLYLHEESVVPAPPKSIALSQQLLEVSDGLNDRPPTLGHRDRFWGAQPLKVHQTDDSW